MINIDELYTDYLSGEVFEKIQEIIGEGVYEDNFQRLDLINYGLYVHPCFIRAEEIATERDLYIDLEWYFDDIFTSVETDDVKVQNAIQGLTELAWKEITSENYFVNKVFLNLDAEVLQVLSAIY